MATNLDAKQLEHVCRLCLTDATEAGHMLPIFPIRGGNPNNPTSMVNRIYQCTSLKLEPREGVPSMICELCSVRLEDWYAFREQCLGSDEYLRVALAHIYCGADGQGMHMMSQFAHHLQQQQQQQQQGPTAASFASESASLARPSPSTSSPPEQSSSRSSSLAKRRKSVFEWTLGDGKGNSTDQKVIVEVLDGGVAEGDDHRSNPSNAEATSCEPILLPEHGGTGGSTAAASFRPRADVFSMLEDATWSKEYCARVNSLMVMVSGTKPYKCKICRKLFKSRSNLRRHIKANHSDEVIEGESPPPECYDFGHIQRTGGTATYTSEQLPVQQQHQQQQQPQVQNGHHYPDGPVKRKRRSNNDPPIVGPYGCHLCPRSFKMPAHLAVHMKTHQRAEEMAPTALGYQLQQQLLLHQQQQQQQQQEQQQQQQGEELRSDSRRSSVVSRKTDIEPTDVIQLSDDDEDEGQENVTNDTSGDPVVEQTDASLTEQTGEGSNTPASIVEKSSVKADDGEEEDDDEDVVIQEVVVPSPPPPPPKAKRIPAPGTIPPGPLSMKARYRESLENGGKENPSPPAQQSQYPSFIVARPKHSPLAVVPTSTPPPTPPTADTATAATGSPRPAGTPPPSSIAPGTTVVHRCHFCQLKFPREDLLRMHQKTHQRDTPLPFRCRWCQKGFRYQQNYTLHVEKQTCRLLNGESGSVGGGTGGGGGGGKPLLTATSSVARPIVANKRAW